MTLFIVLGVALAALALLVLTRPLWPRRGSDGVDTRGLAALREQIAQLASLNAAGVLGEEAYRESRANLERQLVATVVAAPAAASQGADGRRLAAGIALFVVGVATAGYAWLGSPQALGTPVADAIPATQAPGAHSVEPDQIEAMVTRLEKRLQEAPDDADGWAMLARSHAVQGRHDRAVTAFRKAVALRADDAQLLADFADALAVTQGRKLAGEPEKLVRRALEIDPKHLKALSLAGTIAFDRQDWAGAIRLWEQMVQIAPQSELTRQIQGGIEDARQRLGGAAPLPATTTPATATAAAAAATVSGTVSLAPALAAQVRPDDTVFVFARPAEGARMPLAILRKQVRDLPLTFTLDDSMAMSPTAKLSSAGRVVVGARVSRSGNASAQPGDLQGFSAAVAPGAGGLRIEISEAMR